MTQLSSKVEVTVEMTVRQTVEIECTPEQLAAMQSDWTVPNLPELKRGLLKNLATSIAHAACDAEHLPGFEPDWDFCVWGTTNEEEPKQVRIIDWD